MARSARPILPAKNRFLSSPTIMHIHRTCVCVGGGVKYGRVLESKFPASVPVFVPVNVPVFVPVNVPANVPVTPFSCGRGRPASQIWGVVVTAQQLLLHPLQCLAPTSVPASVPACAPASVPAGMCSGKWHVPTRCAKYCDCACALKWLPRAAKPKISISYYIRARALWL